MSKASRVIKNTGFLYAKMCITVIISLYTTRLILSALGASDFGIYSVVGGAIAMMGFLNSTMANATQRFMSFSLGGGDIEDGKRVFNICLVLQLAIALATILLLFMVMLPLFGGILNLPEDRVPSAKIVYLCLIFSTFLTIINVPYDAVITAHENMLYYSIVGVLESVLKLGVAFLCVYSTRDRLVLYGILMACIPLITLSIMKVYCHRHYAECVIAPCRYWDSKKAREILSFSGWNFLTAISSLFTAQGIGLVLNHFWGTLLNAAQGVANQVNGYMSMFSQQLKKAINPVIVKDAGAGDFESMNSVTIAGCKYTTLLILLFAVPCILEMPYILHVWLKEVPEWTVLFCTLQLVHTVVSQMTTSAATAIYAQGNIKNYAIYKSIMNAAPVFVTWICFELGCGPAWLYIPMILIWGIGGDIVVVRYAGKYCGLTVPLFLRGVLLPVFIVAVCMVSLGLLPSLLLEQGVLRLLLCGVCTTLGLLSGLYLFGMDSGERKVVMKAVMSKLHRASI